MEQSVAENSEGEGASSVDEAAEEPVESKDTNSGKIGFENAVESELNDRVEHKSEFSNNDKYGKASHYKTSDSKVSAQKISSQKKGGLEAKLIQISGRSQAKAEGPLHGSLAFIYHTDPETGITEYLIEENKPDYPRREGGKYRLPGGAREEGESSLEALLREIIEEFKSPVASSILNQILKENPNRYTSIPDFVDGKIVITDVYDVDVKSKTDWNIIKMSGSKHDAGTFRAIKDTKILELLHKNKLYFAFGSEHADMIKKFVWENYLTRLNQNHYNKVYATAYSNKIAA